MKKKMIDVAKTDKNYNYFIHADFSRYENEWIAISGKRVIAHGKRADLVIKRAEKLRPRADISFAQILPKKPMILGIF